MARHEALALPTLDLIDGCPRTRRRPRGFLGSPWVGILASIGLVSMAWSAEPQPLGRLTYNHPGLVVDLEVGLWAWPVPLDFDGDGDNDLIVVCPDKPYNGTYLFENTEGRKKFPVFKPARRLGRGVENTQVSYVDGKPRVLAAGREFPEFLRSGQDSDLKLPLPANLGHPGKIRANLWKYLDFDGDMKLDLIVGIGDWTEYGWDDAYNSKGEWTNGPLHGYVYLVRNQGTTERPEYQAPVKLTAGGRVIDVFGRPSPNFADFDGDGDLDLICGEFLDGFTYFENTGTRVKPSYEAGRRLTTTGGRPLVMDLEMISPVAFDWDDDGDFDLIVGDEDGRVALVEHLGRLEDRTPCFAPPVYFQQQADTVQFGALVTPVGCDWDGDGDLDLVTGNTSGRVAFIENLSGPKVAQPRWARPVPLEAGGQSLRIMAGANGSIQGPCEAKWGYTTLSVADWDHDGLPDLVVNSIWGKVVWYRNHGPRARPRLDAQRAIEVDWRGAPPKPSWTWWTPAPNELATQWRTTPVVVDWNRDGLNDLVMLDHEGFLVLFARSRSDSNSLSLNPPRRVFLDARSGEPLQLNPGRAGKSGRRKLTIVDWDGDGRLDILVNSRNATFLRNTGEREGLTRLEDRGPLFERNIEGHDTSPTTVDWDGDGVPDLLIGAEDGNFYFGPHPTGR